MHHAPEIDIASCADGQRRSYHRIASSVFQYYAFDCGGLCGAYRCVLRVFVGVFLLTPFRLVDQILQRIQESGVQLLDIRGCPHISMQAISQALHFRETLNDAQLVKCAFFVGVNTMFNRAG